MATHLDSQLLKDAEVLGLKTEVATPGIAVPPTSYIRVDGPVSEVRRLFAMNGCDIVDEWVQDGALVVGLLRPGAYPGVLHRDDWCAARRYHGLRLHRDTIATSNRRAR